MLTCLITYNSAKPKRSGAIPSPVYPLSYDNNLCTCILKMAIFTNLSILTDIQNVNKAVSNFSLGMQSHACLKSTNFM